MRFIVNESNTDKHLFLEQLLCGAKLPWEIQSKYRRLAKIALPVSTMKIVEIDYVKLHPILFSD